jgi:hypothetical protein
MHTVWPIALLLLSAPYGDRPALSPVVRVRAAQNAVRLLDTAAAESAIVRGLLDRLAATDTIVYVEFTASPQIARARTKLVAATPSARFLRIGLSVSLTPVDAVPLLAHELQHALEIAERTEVRDDAGVRRLYARIGRAQGVDSYETDAAGTIERRVRDEIARRSRAS